MNLLHQPLVPADVMDSKRFELIRNLGKEVRRSKRDMRSIITEPGQMKRVAIDKDDFGAFVSRLAELKSPLISLLVGHKLGSFELT